MPKETIRILKTFLSPYSFKVQEMAFGLRAFVWDLYPGCNELIYDNYNAVAFGWSVSDKLGDTFCSIAAFTDFVHFGFFYGTRIDDPEKRLLGNGNRYRYIKVNDFSVFIRTYIKKLLKQAHKNAMTGLKEGKQVLKGATLVKSISVKKKRPKTAN